MKASGLSKGLFLQLFAATVLGNSSKTPLYKDASAPVEKRVEDLLVRMTIEDKMAQLMQGTFLIWFNFIGDR
jgi:beta-glucosidase